MAQRARTNDVVGEDRGTRDDQVMRIALALLHMVAQREGVKRPADQEHSRGSKRRGQQRLQARRTHAREQPGIVRFVAAEAYRELRFLITNFAPKGLSAPADTKVFVSAGTMRKL